MATTPPFLYCSVSGGALFWVGKGTDKNDDEPVDPPLVYLTADHGNVTATGIGNPREGVLVETRGKRARVYDRPEFREEVEAKFPDSIRWPNHGLPRAPGRTRRARVPARSGDPVRRRASRASGRADRVQG
jgi:hypothetical protein